MTLRAAVFRASRLVTVSIVSFLPVANISNRGIAAATAIPKLQA